MTLPHPVRWLLVPLLAIASCSGLTLGASMAGDGVATLLGASALDAVAPYDVRAGVVYGASALAWVVAGARMAPRARLVVASLLYAAGATLACVVLDTWWFPESHPRAYQASHVPLALTLTGGAAGVAIVALITRRRSASPSGPARRRRADDLGASRAM